MHQSWLPSVLLGPTLLVISACSPQVTIESQHVSRHINGGQETLEGSGESAEELRSLAEFHSVSFSLPGTLFIEQGNESAVRIEGDDNLLPSIVTFVEGEQLQIRSNNVNLRPRAPLRLYLTVADLRAIRGSGSGRIEAPGVDAEEFSVSIRGSGGLLLPNLQAQQLQVQISGSGNVEMSGRVQHQSISVSGSGKVKAMELESEVADVRISGSGSAVVRADRQIDARVSGSGSVRYAGNPKVTRAISGSGKVTEVED